MSDRGSKRGRRVSEARSEKEVKEGGREVGG